LKGWQTQGKIVYRARLWLGVPIKAKYPCRDIIKKAAGTEHHLVWAHATIRIDGNEEVD
jgi:hypothetical protein